MTSFSYEQIPVPENIPPVLVAVDRRAFREMMAIGMEPTREIIHKGIAMNVYTIPPDRVNVVQKRLAIGNFSCSIIKEQ